jgi:hypothetical protein
MFDSDLEGNEDIEIVDMLPAHLSMTAQPADDVIISKTETESESDEKVTIICFQPAAGPSCLLTMLPLKDLSLTKPESDKEPQLATVSMWIVSHLSPISNKHSRLASNMLNSRNPNTLLLNYFYQYFLLIIHLTLVSLSLCYTSLSLNCFHAVQ